MAHKNPIPFGEVVPLSIIVGGDLTLRAIGIGVVPFEACVLLEDSRGHFDVRQSLKLGRAIISRGATACGRARHLPLIAVGHPDGCERRRCALDERCLAYPFEDQGHERQGGVDDPRNGLEPGDETDEGCLLGVIVDLIAIRSNDSGECEGADTKSVL